MDWLLVGTLIVVALFFIYYFFQDYFIRIPNTPRFDVFTEAEKAISYLNQHGYVVFKQALMPAEVEEAKKLLWEFLEGVPLGIKKANVSTWERWPSIVYGLINSFGVGHSPFMWYVRGIPKVKECFRRVWNTDKLLVSFDGCGVFRPFNFKKSWKTRGGWYHVDQNPITKPDMQCVQGLVTLYDCDKWTGNLVVLPGSHKHFHELKGTIRPTFTNDFVSIRSDNPILKRIQPRMIKCKAGDIVLWDSRTIHCNTPALTSRHRQTSSHSWDLVRAVAYVCMTPPSKAGENLDTLLFQRNDAFLYKQTTTHWPHEFHPVDKPSNDKNTLVLNQHQINLLNGN